MKLRPFTRVAVGVALLAGLTACVDEPPAPAPEPDPWDDAIGLCWQPTITVSLDLMYLGPKNTPDNAVLFGSANGTCGAGSQKAMMVQATSLEEAAELCQSYKGLKPGGGMPVNWGWDRDGVPEDAYLC
jgi:hypothetical protein